MPEEVASQNIHMEARRLAILNVSPKTDGCYAFTALSSTAIASKSLEIKFQSLGVSLQYLRGRASETNCCELDGDLHHR